MNNLILLLNCIENNKQEIFNFVNDPKKLFTSSFQRLYKEENIQKIMNLASSQP